MTEDELLMLAWVRRVTRSGAARAARLDAGLSLAELGSTIGQNGVGPGTLSRWETAQRAPHGELALDYAARLRALMVAS